MRITKEHTIWCDRCNRWDQEPTNMKSIFVKQMRQRGWKMRAGLTICPDYVQELKDGRKWDDVGYRSSSL